MALDARTIVDERDRERERGVGRRIRRRDSLKGTNGQRDRGTDGQREGNGCKKKLSYNDIQLTFTVNQLFKYWHCGMFWAIDAYAASFCIDTIV
jgi:hypothetical protein